MNLETLIRLVIPQLISKNLPLDRYETERAEICDILYEILTSKRFHEFEPVQQFIFNAVLSFSSSKEQLNKILGWYRDSSTLIVRVSVAHRHTMVQKIWASVHFNQQTKDEVLAELKVTDSSDKFELTAKYCQAAVPTKENKEAIWKLLFGSESDKLGLYDISNYCSGFRPISQRELIADFAPRFF